MVILGQLPASVVQNAAMQSRSIAFALVLGQVPSLLAGAAAKAQAPHAEPPGLNASPGAASMERGRALLAQYQCGACHTIDGVPAARGQVAQTLSGWGRRSYIAGRLPNRPDVLAQWVSAPHSLVPGTAMPSMGVSPADAQAMAAYLFSLR